MLKLDKLKLDMRRLGMKLFVTGTIVVVILAAVYVRRSVPSDPHAQWKSAAVEPETKVRPARFEKMKFEPGTEVRAPASETK